MIVLVFAAFVSIGLPDALFGAAWPSIKLEFNRSNAAVGVLNVPGSLAYMASSAMLGAVMRKLTLAQLLSSSTAMVAVGLTIYAMAPEFWVIIPAVMLLAAGSGAIDAALNLFAAQHLPNRYMSWLHAFYGIGALTGPFVMALMFDRGLGWRWGYAAVAMVLWVMAIIFVATHGQWQADNEPDEETAANPSMGGWEVMRMPRVRLSLLMMMGGAIVECVAPLWITSILIQRFGVTESRAALGLGAYWISLTIARIVVPVLWPSAAPLRVQRWSSIAVLLASLIMIPNSLILTVIGTVAVGLGVASVFPVAMTITSDRFGPSVRVHAVGYLISSATVMYAVMPPVSGWLADVASFTVIPVLMTLGSAILLITQIILVRGDSPVVADESEA